MTELESQMERSLGGKTCAGRFERQIPIVAAPTAKAAPFPLGSAALVREVLHRETSKSPARPRFEEIASNVSQKAAEARPHCAPPVGGNTVGDELGDGRGVGVGDGVGDGVGRGVGVGDGVGRGEGVGVGVGVGVTTGIGCVA